MTMDRQTRTPEKRKFKRVSVSVKLFYKVQRPPEMLLRVGDREVCTQAVDVSQGGMGFVTGFELPALTEVVVNFNLIFKTASLLNVKAFGKVRHCEPLSQSPDNPSYRIGVEFTKIDEYDSWMIGDFVKDAPSKTSF